MSSFFVLFIVFHFSPISRSVHYNCPTFDSLSIVLPNFNENYDILFISQLICANPLQFQKSCHRIHELVPQVMWALLLICFILLDSTIFTPKTLHTFEVNPNFLEYDSQLCIVDHCAYNSIIALSPKRVTPCFPTQCAPYKFTFDIPKCGLKNSLMVFLRDVGVFIRLSLIPRITMFSDLYSRCRDVVLYALRYRGLLLIN